MNEDILFIYGEKLEKLGYDGEVEESWGDQLPFLYYKKSIDLKIGDSDSYIAISNEKAGVVSETLNCFVELAGYAYIYEEDIEKIRTALEQAKKDLVEILK